MQKKLILLSAVLMIFLFAGGVLVLLGAQEEVLGSTPAETVPGSGEDQTAALITTATQPVAPEDIIATSTGLLYGLSRERGFLISLDNGDTWLERNRGLPHKVIYPFTTHPIRTLTSINIDPLAEGRVAVTTADAVYLSENFGSTWVQIPLDKPLRNTSYLTSVALSPVDPDTLLVGTSFNGFFETKNRGGEWTDPSLKARFLYRGAGFYEEISGLSYHPDNPETIFFSCGFGRGLYRGQAGDNNWETLSFPGDKKGEIIRSLRMEKSETGWILTVDTDHALWHYRLDSGLWRLVNLRETGRSPDPFRSERLRKAADRTGIYMSSYHASGETSERHLAFLKAQGLNSFVVDVKDDYGWITYDTRLELPRQVGAVNRRFKLEELLSKAQEQELYVIARLVVFKDRQLYNYGDHKFALWNRLTDQPWRYLVATEVPPEEKEETETEDQNGEKDADQVAESKIKYVQNEYWVDPFNPEVWRYNLAIAEELQARGVDEIQFDYIRFPSDGPLSQIRYRYQRENMSRIDALESFLSLVRERIHIPISTDLYGFNSWHRMGNWIGQSIDTLAEYVDVICPMFYPSHFPPDFIKELSYLDRAEQIYREGTTRAASITGQRSIIRPYIQAFLIGGELNMDRPEYGAYLTRQIDGVQGSPGSGWTLWNASNRYYMVIDSLQAYTTGEAPALKGGP